MSNQTGRVRSFVTAIRRAMAGEITVRTWWGCSGLTGEALHQWFRQRQDAKISREDCRRWRGLSADYQAALMRDAIRLREITGHRIIHRQFETDIVNRRFSHRLTKDT
jgi:hypothetical protein